MDNLTVEYGARWKSVASSPELERVIRKDGVISLWKTQFNPNVGGDYGGDAFDGIDLFSPRLVTDAQGNTFRRFGKFYVGEQTLEDYEYIWVCKTLSTPFYRVQIKNFPQSAF